MEDCTSARTRTCLEFLAPILNPEKPRRLTIRLANTIMGAFSGERSVNWGILIRGTIEKLVRNVGMTRPTPISPFLYHLYRRHELLTGDEEEEHLAGMEASLHGIEDSEEDADAEELPLTDTNEDGSEDEGPGLAPVPEVPTAPIRVHTKETAQDSRGAPPPRGESSRAPTPKPQPAPSRPAVPEAAAGQPILAREQHADPMMNLVMAVGYAREEYNAMRDAINGIQRDFGVTSLAEIKAVIDARPMAEDVKVLE